MRSVDPRLIQSRLRELSALPGVPELVAKYLQGPPATPFAGTFFDTLGNNPPEEIAIDDIAAVCLLDVRLTPPAVHRIIHDGAVSALPATIPVNVDLWEADEQALLELESAYHSLKAIGSVGRTTASKLLARKRPRLAPITDSIVERAFNSRGWEHLRALRLALQDSPDLISYLTRLADGRVSPLRALDIAIWMLGSRSNAAQTARNEIRVSSWPKY